VETLAASTPADRHFMVQRDVAGAATLLFGDGANGLVPPRAAPISATYRTGGGSVGNVPAGTRFQSSIPLVREAVCFPAAAGGTDAEPLERARFFAPRLFRTQERAVTLGDYVDLALQVPGVGKARAVAPGWNEVILFVAPAGRVAEPSELLTRDILDFFERRRMATTLVRVRGPREVDVYLRADVRAQPYFLESDVRAAAERAVAAYLDFDAVEFGQPIYLSKIYDAIQSLEEVASLTVTEFSRTPGGGIETDGVLELGPHELPRPGYRDNPFTPDPLDPGHRPPILLTIQGGVAA
jgi:predicted phage baseplate assembly protein